MSTESESRIKLTYEDYCAIPDDRSRHEIIDGEHLVNPAPGTYHQTVSRRLHFELYEQIERTGRGQVFNAPTDLQLSEIDIVQPDLLVIVAENQDIITPSRILGVPDLVVEILSPSTARIDRRLKKDLYERAGIPEYWLVDPDAHCLEQLRLESDRYRLTGTHAEHVVTTILDGITVDLTRVW
jgi:Uma2 family endonuclease